MNNATENPTTMAINTLVDNATKKLGARNRPQVMLKTLASCVIFKLQNHLINTFTMFQDQSAQTDEFQHCDDGVVHEASELIGRYNTARDRLTDLLSSLNDPQADELKSIEAEVEMSFNALLSANFSSGQEVWLRALFLIDEIRKSLDSGSIVDRMAKTIEDDIFKMTRNHDATIRSNSDIE